MEEIWKDVVGYEGRYQISNQGRVKRLSYLTLRRDGSRRLLKEKILKGKGTSLKRLHQRVSFWNNHSSVDFYIHRLVARAFIPKVEGKDYINHKDGNPLNNNVDNLEWCTIAENNLHATRTGLRKHGFKIKLTRLKDGEEFLFPTQCEASHFIGRSQSFVGWCIRNEKQPKDLSGNEYKAERL